MKSHKPKHIGLTSGAGTLTSSVFFPSRFTLKIGRRLNCEKSVLKNRAEDFIPQKATRTVYLLTQLSCIKMLSQNVSFIFFHFKRLQQLSL